MTDRQLLKTVKSFRKGILGNKPPGKMCFAICFPLQSFLHCIGLNLELVKMELKIDGAEYEHYVLKLPDGRILDPTASQFNHIVGTQMPEIYLGELPNLYKVADRPHL